MQEIIKQFQTANEIGEIRPLKIGHINDSFILESKTEKGESYFLQKINHNIFKDIARLQENIRLVTDHLRAKLIVVGETDIERKVLQLVPTKSGEWFHQDKDGGYWRMYINIKGTHGYNAITPELAFKAGEAFGNFQCMLSDISHDQLVETIPNFHNMEFRLEQFREAVRNDTASRVTETQTMIDEIEKRAFEMCKAERLYREGKLPKRINHCDTKVNNLLFDEKDEPICIVDLDTVMPGFVLSDFGDFMRTAANTAEEDEANLSLINVDMDVFKAYTQGYLKKATFLTPIEIENLVFGAQLLSYMQTVRFFTDYLNGDIYYKIKSPNHNWHRTLAQFRLLEKQEENFEQMQQIVQNCR